MKPSVLVAIPAYRCAGQITRVLDEINDKLASRVAEIAVIDNGSSDDTVQVALDYKKKGRLKNLHIYQNVNNYNLGGTHKVAFLRAQELGLSHVMIIHGDNQAKSDEGNLLLDYVEEHPETQTVLGSRFSKASTLIGYDWKRIAGNRVLNLTYSIITMRNCQDLGSGLNLFALRDLDQRTYLGFADKLTFNFELLLDLIRRNVKFAYVAITWREEDQTSNARNFNIFKTALLNLFRWRFTRTKPTTNKPEDYQCREIN
ncbi:MAG: glycosyltransferase family 2 protein [Cytophaga sp.]|nr:glycosyltransferase family 2 protein [Undibacterium sp.]